MSKPFDNLTMKQSKALDYIRYCLDSVGTAPTLRELCTHMGYSAVGSAQDVIAALRKKGFLLTPDKQTARSFQLSEKALAVMGHQELDPNTFAINCLGTVPAGNPLEAVAERTGVLRMSMSMMPRPLPNPENLFALQVTGLSMIDAGIYEGDWLVVNKQEDAQAGELVVARLGEDSTIKRLMKDDQGWFLKPENPSFKNIYATDDEPFEIVGKVLALQRVL